MFVSSRIRLALVAVLGLALSPLGSAGAEKGDFKRVPIPTFDGVKLEGTFYPAGGGGKKDACVLLVHNFDPVKGGDSHADGWDHLAEALQKEGYAVLSFDFRGFGQSKSLENPEKFWMSPHNRQLRGAGAAKLPESIDHKRFPTPYYPHLVDDIAAAKAYLDRKNDQGEVNSSNLVVIAAGQGAALSALWLAAQCHLQRDRETYNKQIILPDMRHALDDPEIKDVAAAVFLSLSPSVSRIPFHLKGTLLPEVGRENKIPMAFVYGAKDAQGAAIAKECLSTIRNGRGGKDLKLTGERGIADTALTGSALLQDGLKTEDWIIKKYLEPVMEARGNRERKKREIDKYCFYWAFPKPGPTASLVPSKVQQSDPEQGPVPLDRFGLGRERD
jgi:hypothetical protein